MASMVTRAPSSGQVIEQDGNGHDLVGLFGHAQLRVGGVGAERVQRLQSLAFVVGPARGLAVDGDEIVSARPNRMDPVLETTRECQRIDAVHQRAKPAFAGDSMMKRREHSQKDDMMLAPGDDFVEMSQQAMVAQVSSSRTSASES